jgi:hypothetical protein
MSNTPETDAAIKEQSEWKLPFVSTTMDGVTYDGPVASFCRRMERERDEAREDAAHWKSEWEIVEARLCGWKHPRDNGITFEHEIILVLRKERDEAREQNVKLRDIADTAIEYVGHTSVQQKLRSELKQNSDELHRMSVIEMMDYNLNVKHHVEEWENRCIKAERERDEARFLLKQAQSALDAIHLEVGDWIKTMKENTD